MAATYNRNSSGIIKKEEIQWQYNINVSVRSKQQRSCMNFVRRRTSATLHNIKFKVKKALQTLYKHYNNSEAMETTPRINAMSMKSLVRLKMVASP